MPLLNILELLPSPQETLKLIAPQRSSLVGKQTDVVLVMAVPVLAHGVGPGDLPIGTHENTIDPVLAGSGVVERIGSQGVAGDDVVVQQLLVVDVSVELDGRVLKRARVRVLRVGRQPLDPRGGEVAVPEPGPGDLLQGHDGDGAPGLGDRGGGLGGVLAVDGRVAGRVGVELELGLAAVLADLVGAGEGPAGVREVLDDNVWDCGGEGRHEEGEGCGLLHFVFIELVEL
jgi:hypothetical protein